MSVNEKRVDISYVERDEMIIQFTVKDRAGAVVDITGGTVHWGLAADAKEEAFLVEKQGAGEAEVSDGPNGLIDLTLDAADTAALDGTYHHRCKLTLSGRTETVAWGEFFICPTPA